MINVITIRNWLEFQVTRVYSRMIGYGFRRYAASYVHPTTRIDNPQHIVLDGVSIGRWCWLYAMTGDTAGHSYEPELSIGKGTQIGDFCHITCAIEAHARAKHTDHPGRSDYRFHSRRTRTR